MNAYDMEESLGYHTGVPAQYSAGPGGYNVLASSDFTDKDRYHNVNSQQTYPVNDNSKFEVSDAEETLKLLRKAFQIKNPGYHVCKRSHDHSSISFTHCRHVLGLGKQYVALRKIMEERARLEFMRDCAYRVRSVKTFVQELEVLAHSEFKTFYAITHKCISEAPMSKLYCLNALCEDLRTQFGHWNSIKQRVHTNKWLQPMSGRIYIDLEHVHHTLFSLYHSAVYWMEKLISTGMQVLAHSQLSNLNQDVLWNISRGLDDYNNIISNMPKARYKPCAVTDSLQSEYNIRSARLDPFLSNRISCVAGSAKHMPFKKILNIISTERSCYAAIETHRFFTGNEGFLHLLNSGKLPPYVWNDEVHNSQNPSHAVHFDTSDYHTQSGSLTSISGAVLKVGSVRAPDLSQSNPPLSGFANQEKQFVQVFLNIVCTSTHLLRKNDSQSKSSKKAANKAQKSASFQKPPRGLDTPVLSRSDSKRKTVSWGDSDDGSIRNQLVNYYMENLWKCFSTSLEHCFHEPCWGARRGKLDLALGSILFCNATLIAIIRNMIEHVCLKDLFPSGTMAPMFQLVRKLHTMAALSSWDLNVCAALASRISDKCYPCPLAGGDYSTKTAMLLRDAYHPLFSILQEHLKDLSESGKNSTILVPKQELDLVHVTSLISRLFSNCVVANSWCVQKSQAFLSSWSVGNFLLITQTDLKLLADETKKALYQAELFCGKTRTKSTQSEQQVSSYLNEITQQLGIVNLQLQTLSGAVMRTFSENCLKIGEDFFKKYMPAAKFWKKKTALEYPKENSPYIENALETLLEPVVEGVSKLKQTAQLSTISMATQSLCEALKNQILKEKIKFSYIGASQLELDVAFVKKWLCEYIIDKNVQQSIVDLDCLKYLTGAVMILKKQPYLKVGSSRFKEPCSSEDMSCSRDDTVSRNKGEKSPDFELDGCEEELISYVSNIDEWLSLRVVGGAKIWKFPLCLNSSPTNA